MVYKILWLEDDIDVIGAFVRPIEQEGHIVEKIPACIDAVARLGAEKYDAVILDVILPQDAWTRENGTYHDGAYYGLDVLKFMREKSNNRDVPVVVFSVLPHGLVQEEITKTGLVVNSILPKITTTREQLKGQVLESIAKRG